MGKIGGLETGIETGGREGALDRTDTSGVGERGGVSLRAEPSSSELWQSDSLGIGVG